jgi:hypothetical protein
MRTHRPLLVCTAALAVVSAMASPALAQTPTAPPAGPPPDAAPSTTPSIVAPMMAPKSANDLTGSVGFGVGIASNVELVGTTADVAIKYWMHDNLALVPQLNFNVTNVSSAGGNPGGTTWVVAPQLQLLFVPFQSTSTRLEIGGGVGFGVGKAVAGGSTFFDVSIPIQAGVEHFFTRWFSTGIAIGENFFAYAHPGGGAANTTAFNLYSGTGAGPGETVLAASLFFYTD